MAQQNAGIAYNNLAKKIELFCRANEVELCILFGSQARGTPRAASDIDIALQFPLGYEPSKLQLIHELEMIFMPKMVDLVLLNAATDPLLLHEIFAHGKLLFERSEGLFAKGKLRAWHLYLDSAPLRRKEREFINKTFKDRADVP